MPQTSDTELYQALLERRSVRRYSPRPPEPEKLSAAAALIPELQPLVPDNRFRCELRPIPTASDTLAAAIGSYARIISAPWLALPGIRGENRLLEDCGYRLEQLVIGLTRLGLGTCWIGALTSESKTAQTLGVEPGWRVPAVIVFGYPDTGLVGRSVNQLYRGVIGAPNRLPYEKFVFAERFGQPATPAPQTEYVLAALRCSPSAGNARPWRVILRGDRMFYCVDTAAGFYRRYRCDYPLLDGGIGMASVTLALRSLGQPAEWELLDETPELRTDLGLPASVRLLAAIRFGWPA